VNTSLLTNSFSALEPGVDEGETSTAASENFCTASAHPAKSRALATQIFLKAEVNVCNGVRIYETHAIPLCA
jgi:hypothetical protein